MFKKITKLKWIIVFMQIFSCANILSADLIPGQSSADQSNSVSNDSQVDQSSSSANSDGWIDIENGWIYDNWR